MALGDEYVIKLDSREYRHIGAVGQGWIAVNDDALEARYIVEATSGATVTRADKLGLPLAADLAIGGVAIASLLPDGATPAGHIYARGTGRMVRTDLADGVTAPVG